MKGYHCSSDSVNLRVLYSVCVCVSLSSRVCALCSICIYCWGVWRSWYSATVILTLPVRPPDSTVYPAMLTVAASHSFLRTVLKLHSLSLILTKPLGSSISISAQERGRKEESGKRGRAVQLSLCLSFSFLFSSSHLKLWDTHLSLIAHRHSTRKKVLWICINTAYGSSSAGTRCVQKVECCRCIILHSNYHSKNAAGSREVFTTSLDGAGEEPGSCKTAGTEELWWAQ